MVKVIDLIDNLLFVQKNRIKGNLWHIHKESDYDIAITYCGLDFQLHDHSARSTNDEQYEWQFGKKWHPENICLKCIKSFELVGA